MLYSSAITCFLEVAKEQNISRAARALYISPQAVSKQVQRLERELNTTLFNRSTSPLSLTPAGRLYYSCFSEMLQKLEEVQNAVKALPPAEEIIKVGCIKGLGIENDLSRVMSVDDSFMPTVRILWERDEPYSLTQRLLEKDFDIIFSYSRDLESANIEAVPFMKSKFCLVAGKTMPGIENMKDISDFNECPFMTWMLTGTTEAHSRKGFLRLLEDCGLSPKNVFVLPNMESLQTGIAMGNGVTLASDHDRICHSELVKVFPLDVDCSLSAAWRKDEQSYVVRELSRNIRQKLTEK